MIDEVVDKVLDPMIWHVVCPAGMTTLRAVIALDLLANGSDATVPGVGFQRTDPTWTPVGRLSA